MWNLKNETHRNRILVGGVVEGERKMGEGGTYLSVIM